MKGRGKSFGNRRRIDLEGLWMDLSGRMGMNGPAARSTKAPIRRENLLYYPAMQHKTSIIDLEEMPKGGTL